MIRELIVPGMILVYLVSYFVPLRDAPWVAIRYPLSLAPLLICLIVVQARRALTSAPDGQDSNKAIGSRWKLAGFATTSLCFPSMAQFMGFPLAALLFLVVTWMLLGERRPLIILGLGLLTVGALTSLLWITTGNLGIR